MNATSLRFSEPVGLVTSAAGRVALVHGDDAIRQAIMLLLGTTPGERLMRPDYGSHLHRLLFAPNDQTTAGLAIHYVRHAIERWEPRVEIEEVDADPDPDIPSRLNVHLRYRVRQTLATGVLDYPLDLGEQP
ncbi:GPW/gp25 family protein [Catellatospora tritici]|uniref:GPW/gp25 family protein n=1 Tax=Catellatospora tritici TaxID=2851566 RepID=UPI0027DFE8D9|nr:GPW/gp25 family protein [Catellatospora tritici]